MNVLPAATEQDASASRGSTRRSNGEPIEVETNVVGGDGNAVAVGHGDVAREVIRSGRADGDRRKIGNRRAWLNLRERLHDPRGCARRGERTLAKGGRLESKDDTQGKNEEAIAERMRG